MVGVYEVGVWHQLPDSSFITDAGCRGKARLDFKLKINLVFSEPQPLPSSCSRDLAACTPCLLGLPTPSH